MHAEGISTVPKWRLQDFMVGEGALPLRLFLSFPFPSPSDVNKDLGPIAMTKDFVYSKATDPHQA